MANKNSIYLTALADFIKDTKPYHTKLAAVDSIYQFSENLNVKINERMFTTLSANAAWTYPYFSSGVSSALLPSIPMHRIVSPELRGKTKNSDASNPGSFKAFRDENTDLPLIKFAFDPKYIQGLGLADAYVQRKGNDNSLEGLIEGHDVFLSHGAYVFQIQQTKNSRSEPTGRYVHEFTTEEGPYPKTVSLDFSAFSYTVTGPASIVPGTNRINVTGPGTVVVNGFSQNGAYNTLFTEKQNEDLILNSTASTQAVALDKSNPSSNINKILALLQKIQLELNDDPDSTSQAELNAVLDILNASVPNLPKSYDGLINALIAANINVPNGFTSWKIGDTSVLKKLSFYSPAIYFNEFSDSYVKDSGNLNYKDVPGKIKITDIVSSADRQDYEEYTVRSTSTNSFIVSGSNTGVINTIQVPSVNTPVNFSSSQVSFKIARSDTVVSGDEVKLTPSRKITIHKDAPLEAWSIVKVNPIAYSRPVFNSTRYGYITSSKGLNFIDVLDLSFSAGSVILEAVSSSRFKITSTSSSYTGLCTVNVPFNDGKLSFTIKTGSSTPFSIGDRFYVEIKNDPASAKDLDLSFGYDTGPFDADELVYNTVNSAVADYLTKLEFGYDSRFINYDLSLFNLQIAQSAVNNRQWRLRAIPDENRPLPLQNTTPKNQINEIGTDDPLNPDALTQLDMPNDVTSEGSTSSTDPDTLPDILVYYSSAFALEYFDDIEETWVLEDTVNLNDTYANSENGLSFKMVPGTKPFIGTRVRSSFIDAIGGDPVSELIDGGDVISFVVQNTGPEQTDPSNLVSKKAPRLVIHGDSFHDVTAADFSIVFINESQYEIKGIFTEGPLIGTNVYTSKIVSLKNGNSYQDEHLHFTVHVGNGVNAGDTFKLSTYSKKPSYLVHGSLSGWQVNATVNEWYWNGKIGFKIQPPKIRVIQDNVPIDGVNQNYTLNFGNITVSHLRSDTEDSLYSVRSSNSTGHWLLYKNGTVISHGKNLVQDKFISVVLPDPSNHKFDIFIEGDSHTLYFGHDLAIVRTTPGRSPTSADFVQFDRTEQDNLLISIKSRDTDHADVLKGLYPVNTDIRYVDHNANSGVPLSATSPETDILAGWIPLDLNFRDAGGNTEFPDESTNLSIVAAGTGEVVGSITPVQDNLNKVLFNWDTAFHDKYLPLNAECTFVSLSSGLNDIARINIKDGVVFLFSGGGLDSDALFSDEMTVNISAYAQFKIKSTYQESILVDVIDGPFTGFLAGYDNLPYDEETPDGAYDVGAALTFRYERAQELYKKEARTKAEELELQDCLSVIDPYLSNGINTTFAEFKALMDADTFIGTPSSFGFGIPDLGHGIDIEEQSASIAGTVFVENISLNSEERGYPYDRFAFDVGFLDQNSNTICNIFYSGNDVSIPASGVPENGIAYAEFDTPLHVIQAANTFELVLPNISGQPTVYIWLPDNYAPHVVPILQKVTSTNSTKYRFSIPKKSELKMICTIQ